MDNKTQKEWESAVDNVKTMLEFAEGMHSWTMMFYINGCKDMLKRYESGERSEELYQEMINLH